MSELNPLRGLTSNISLVGNDDQIKTQMALLLGVTQLTESQLKGFDIDFIEWAEKFEEGFVAGYGAKQHPLFSKKHWGQPQKTRPRIRVIREVKPNWEKQGYYLIEFQPDRTVEAEAYLLFDTPRNLISQIMFWMNLHLRLKNLDVKAEGASSYRLPLTPKFKDRLQLTLVWRGITEATLKNHTIEKSLRIMDVDPKTVSLNYLQDLGRKTLSKFDSFNFKTGHVKVKYTKWDDGFQTWGYFDVLETGYKIIEAMGDLVGKSIDKEYLTYEFNASPLEAYNQKGEVTTIAGKSVRTRGKAPIANMRFYGATILFPYINHTEQLCNISGYVLRDLSFLDSYDE